MTAVQSSSVGSSSLAVGMLLAGTLSGQSFASDWAQWRGPQRNGVSAESAWLVEGKPDSIWSASVGLGYSAFAVQDGRLYTLGYETESGNDVVTCLNAESGEKLWTHAYPSGIWNQGHDGGTLATPTDDSGSVFVKDREGKMFCLDAQTGAVVWSKDLIAEFGASTGMWGFSSTPLVLDERVIVDAGITFAFDRKTGDLLWKTQDYGQGYATPIDLVFGGTECVAVFNKRGLVILDLADGSEKASHDWPTMNDINAATPIVVDDRIFIASGRGCAMLRIREGALEVVWESKVLKTSMNAAVLWEGHLYGFDGNTLKCIDLDGNEMWSQRGIGLGAMMIADGRVILLSGKGELVFADASPAGYHELGRTKVLDGGKYWTTPVLVDGRIYCRNSRGDLVCRDHRTQ